MKIVKQHFAFTDYNSSYRYTLDLGYPIAITDKTDLAAGNKGLWDPLMDAVSSSIYRSTNQVIRGMLRGRS